MLSRITTKFKKLTYLQEIKNNPKKYIKEIILIFPILCFILNGIVLLYKCIRYPISNVIWNENRSQEDGENNMHMKRFITCGLVIFTLLFIGHKIRYNINIYRYLQSRKWHQWFLYSLLMLFVIMGIWNTAFSLSLLLKRARKNVFRQYDHSIQSGLWNKIKHYFDLSKVFILVSLLFLSGIKLFIKFCKEIYSHSFKKACYSVFIDKQFNNKTISSLILICICILMIVYCYINKNKVFKKTIHLYYLVPLSLISFIIVLGLWYKINELANIFNYSSKKTNFTLLDDEVIYHLFLSDV